MAFKGLAITYDGQSLLTQTQISKQFAVKCVRIGDGKYSADHHDIHSMVNPLYDVVPEIQHKDNQLLIEADITSNDHSGYYLREIGIIATDAAGQEVLYAYDNAGNDAEYINPVNSGIAYEKRLRFALIITDDITINIQINGSVYALQRDLVQHVNNQSNPHNVTVEQLGLDKVDNTSDKDKPISDAAKKALDGKEPAFSKNSAFNKAFGNAAGTVCQGNDSRLSDARKNPVALTFTGGVTGSYDGSVAKSVYIPTSLPASDVSEWAKAANKPEYTKSEVGLSNVDNTSDKDKPISDATKKALDGKEPLFSKNSAFNKAFGNAAGTVCQGNDSRLSDARTPKAHNHDDRYYTENETNEIVATEVEQSKALIMDSVNSVEQRVEYIEENGVVTGDTIPVSGGITCDADKIPTGYKKVEPPFSNPNLLINGDFQVWQRGISFSAFYGFTYTADRWTVYKASNDNVTITKVDKGLQFQSDNAILNIRQYLENKLQIGKEYILSAIIDEMFYSMCFTAGTDKREGFLRYESYATNSKSDAAIISFVDTDVHVINWVKLEIGEIATPFVPRPYAEELMLCQRYYQMIRFGFTGYSDNTNMANISTIYLKVLMRIKPTITAVNLGSDTNIKNISYTYSDSGTIQVSASPNVVGTIRTYDKIITLDSEIY